MRNKKATFTELLLVLLVSVILSNGTIFNTLSPFSVAFLSALSGISAVASLLGGTIGFLVFGKFAEVLHSFVAMLFVLALGVFCESLKIKITPKRKAFFTGLIVIICDVFTSAFIAKGLFGVVLLIIDGVVCGFLSYSASFLVNKIKLSDLIRPDNKEIFFMSIGLFSTICALSSFELWFFNWGRILGMIVVLLFARKNMSEAVICAGITIGAIALGNLSFTYSTALLTVSAVVVFFFKQYGRFAQSLIFISISSIQMFILGIDVYSAGLFIDAMISAVICMFIKTSPEFFITDNFNACEYATKKLMSAADAVNEVKVNINKVAQMLDKKGAKNLDYIYEKASGIVCRNCDKNMSCWQENYNETARAMSVAVKQYNNKSLIKASDLPVYLQKNCSRCAEFAEECNGFYNSYLADLRASRKLLSQRKIMINQLDLAKEMFIKVSSDLANFNEPKRLIYIPQVKVSVLPAEKVSGDTYNAFCDDDGNFYFCLFDGMGQGKRASVDSEFLSSVVGGLAVSGIEMETVMKTANDCMMVKSVDESFSTADVIKIDLSNGEAEIIKAGSAPTYLMTKNRVRKISTETFPLGVFSNTKPEKTNINVSAGDIFVIASDGAGDITEILEKTDTKNIEILADRILDFAKENNKNHTDDVSVALIKVNINS